MAKANPFAKKNAAKCPKCKSSPCKCKGGGKDKKKNLPPWLQKGKK